MAGTEETQGGSAVADAGPTTFEEAFATETESPTVDPTTETSPAAAAEQPDESDSGQPQEGEGREPFIPRARFDEVNGRLKDAVAWREAHKWAEALGADDFQQVLGWYQRAGQDPVGFVQQMLSELQADPTHGPRLRSLAAKTLATRTAEKPAADDTMPEPDLDVWDAKGNVVGRTYSDRGIQARDQWLTRQIIAQVQTALNPKLAAIDELTSDRDARAAREQVEAESRQADEFAKSFHGELKGLPGFDQHREAIAKTIAETELPADAPPDAVRALALQAYIRIVLPTLTSSAQSQLLDSLEKKAAASTSSPSSRTSSTPQAPKGFFDPSLKW